LLPVSPHAWTDIVCDVFSPHIERRAVHAANATVARFILAKGASVARHSHESEQISMVLEGALRLEFDEGTAVVRPGELIVIPPHVPHAATALEDSVVLDFFSPRREDWLRHEDAYLRVGVAPQAGMA
jgi:quercetin dioxygenase-like cupin family protein